MEDFSTQNIDKISHNIASLSKDMYEIKKTILSKEKEREKVSKKDKRRRESLKKAQAKFKNVSTNLNVEEFKKLEEKLKKIKKSKSAYLKELIINDLE